MRKIYLMLAATLVFAVLSCAAIINTDAQTNSAGVNSPGTPAEFTAKLVYKAVELKWKSSPGADYYLIYRNNAEEFAKDPEKNNCILQSTSEASDAIDDTITEGQTYYYYILAVAKDKDNSRKKIYSQPSAPVKITVEKQQETPVQTAVFTPSESGEINITKLPAAAAVQNEPANSNQPGGAKNETAKAPENSENNISIDLQADNGADGIYSPGNDIKIRFSVSENAYVTIINLGTSGKASIIFPNERSTNNYIKKGDIYTIPENSSYKIKVHPPLGDEYLIAVASREKIAIKPQHLAALALPDMRYAIAGRAVLTRELKVEIPPSNATPVETPINNENFKPFFNALAMDVKTAFATTTSRIKIRSADKMLRITSDPAGAKILIDGIQSGQTPCDISGSSYPGEHELTFVMPGYETNSQKITFPAAHDKNLHLELKPVK
ncbi:MAG: DUF4384 domain-containing protein [Candidatus Wallbacteria bacterium]